MEPTLPSVVDPLDIMIESQRSFTANWIDFEKAQVDHEYLQHWTLDQIGHVIEECVELRKELPARKHWKKQSKPLDFEKIKDEYSDILHFVINVGLVIGLKTSKDFFDIYKKKHAVVLERQENGY